MNKPPGSAASKWKRTIQQRDMHGWFDTNTWLGYTRMIRSARVMLAALEQHVAAECTVVAAALLRKFKSKVEEGCSTKAGRMGHLSAAPFNTLQQSLR
eukprot:47202-Pelagomonas_calceolata.AAC.6